MSAPSFSSFPPSFSSFPDLDPSSSKDVSNHSTENEQRERNQDIERKMKKAKGRARVKDREAADRHKPRREEREHSQHRESTRDVLDEHTPDGDKRMSEAQSFLDSVLQTRSVYYSDRRGDELTLKYGRLHAGDVPKYNLIGRGRKILGLNNAFSVVHRGQRGLEVDIGRRRKVPELTDSRARHLLRAPPIRRLIASSDDKYKYSEVDGFLRLPSSSRSKRKSLQPSRDITTISPDSEGSQSSSSDDDDVDSDDSDTISLTSRQAILKTLEAQLTEDPTSISAWLSLLAYTVSSIPAESKNSQKARSEVALSVLARALAAHPNNETSEQLRLKYLRAGEELWTEDVLVTEWEQALKVPGADLWIQWLDWRIRVAPKGMEGVGEDTQRALASLPIDDHASRIRAFWRVAIAFRDAGFVERANGLFQAQAELTFKQPSDLLSLSFDDRLNRLEEFWDSEVPRVGEVNAMGWAVWEAKGRPEAESSSTSTPQWSMIEDPYTRWATDELHACRLKQSLPARRADEDSDSDPYSTVLFTDLRPFLLDLPSKAAKQTFRLVWLAFLGLHIPGLSASVHGQASLHTDDRWNAVHFSAPEFLSAVLSADSDNRLIAADAQSGVLVGREREYGSTFGPVKNWSFDVFSPLEGIGSDSYTMFARNDLASVNTTVVREVFRQCVLPTPEVDWQILHLAFEAALDAKTSLKLSKVLLATVQGSLRHWAAHARLERMRGRPDDARKVYSNVLPSVTPETADAGLLWWDWAELEWQSQATESAIRVILRSTGSNGEGTVALLRCKRRLVDLQDEIPRARWRERQAWLKLQALLEVLTVSIDAAVLLLDSHLKMLSHGTLVHESLTVASLLMLYVHSTVLRNPTPPVLLRERAERAIEFYPSNTIILGLFLEAEKGQAVWGNVRRVLGDGTVVGVAKEKDIPRRVAEVWAAGWERGRWKAEEERTRARLSAAAQEERTRCSAILWKIYLEFEIRAGGLKRAKKLLFRAIGECPLVKELYLLAFIQLRSVFTSLELNELAEVMAERGIRLKEGLDEALVGWNEPVAADVPRPEVVRDAGEDEIEYNAEELRRLRPY